MTTHGGGRVQAVLGPTNTGKTHFALERMLGHGSGMIGFPLRLLAFGVINTYNHAVRTIGDVLGRLTEPVLRPIRHYMPDFGAIDLSPIVLWLVIIFLQMVDQRLLMTVAGL